MDPAVESTKGFAGLKKQLHNAEENEIKRKLMELKTDMDQLYNCFENVTDQLLVDSCIYQLMATQKKYQFYLELAKEKGIQANIIKKGR